MTIMTNPRPLTLEDGPLVWIDCEMTGLNPKRDVLLEIAVIITNGDLERVDQGISYVIKTDKRILDGMRQWCIDTHGQTGLTAACLSSKYTHNWVEARVLEYIKRWIPERRIGVLAGNSVHTDKAFLREYMPSLTNWLHYRIVDVSSIYELRKRWFPEIEPQREDPAVEGVKHRAFDDIESSISKLEWYRENIFIKPTSSKPETSENPDHPTSD